MSTGTGDGGDLTRHRWLLLAVACVGSFMGPVDITGVAVALPAMGRSLRLSFSEGLWVSAAYLLTYTLALVPMGRVADQWGRLRLWRVGVGLFAAMSLCIVVSPDPAVLLILRGVQGVGAALLASTATALVSAAFPIGERGRAIGLNVTAIYLGLAVGPLIGGFLVSALGWRWVFLVNIPVALAALLVSRRLHEPRPMHGRPQVDIPGTITLGVGLAAGLVPMTFGPLWGWTAPGTLALIGLAAAALTAFVVIQRRSAQPLLDPRVFRGNRLFTAASAAALLNYTAMFGGIALTAVLLEVVGGHSALRAGLLLIVQPAFMVALSPVAGHLSDRIGSRLLATGGMVLIAVGLSGLATIPRDLPTPHLLVSLALVGIGMAGFSSPNTSAAMGSVPPQIFGVAAAVLATMRSLGQSLSVAALGAIAASGLGARGGRVILGGRARAGDAIAYLDGYHTAMAVGAVVALVGAAISLVRGRPD